MEFKDLNLMDRILDAIRDEGYTSPSPIQEQAIPPALMGRDILGCAQTGTGKTAAFAMPILQRLDKMTDYAAFSAGAPRKVRALILTPTRELALQIYDSFRAYGRYLKLRTAVIMGGVAQGPQVDAIKRGLDILVATPGRLLDLVYQGILDIGRVEILVLDEADRMLDMGFVDDVKKVIEIIPEKRQTLFFTATMPPEILKLTKNILTDPVSLAVTPVSSTVDLTTQYVYFVDKSNKLDLMIHLLKADKSIKNVLIFSKTKHGANKLSEKLSQAGIRSQAIHGNKSQGARQSALDGFKRGSIRALVATDIAARGIDIDELSHVVNYELPNVPETYVHRIGRTGRAGHTGVAISFCDFDEKMFLNDIERLTKKKLEIVDGHPYPMKVFTKAPPKQRQPRPNRGRSGGEGQNRGNGGQNRGGGMGRGSGGGTGGNGAGGTNGGRASGQGGRTPAGK